MEIFNIYHIEAARRLPRLPESHPCSRVHGHSFRVEIYVSGPVNPESGWVIDFAMMEKSPEPIMGKTPDAMMKETPDTMMESTPGGMMGKTPEAMMEMSAWFSAALTNATGLGITNLTGGAVSQSWGAVAHSLIGGVLVWVSGYAKFEKLMKLLVGIMGFSILVCAALTMTNPGPALQGLFVPTIPADGGRYVLSLIGGIGGSITMLSYNYWMREEKMHGAQYLGYVRGDVAVAYIFTAIFGLSIMLIASGPE